MRSTTASTSRTGRRSCRSWALSGTGSAGCRLYGATISGAGPSVLVWCERGAAAAVADSLAGVAPRILRLSVSDAGVVVG